MLLNERTDLPPEFYKSDAGAPDATRHMFFCSWKKTGDVGPDGHCGLSLDECQQYSALAADKGSVYGPCEGSEAAACYSSLMVIRGRRTESCFPSMGICKEHRSWTMKELADDFTDFEECRPVR